MKLNAHVLTDALAHSLNARLTGLVDSKALVGRPEFFNTADTAFNAGHLYVVRAEQLPSRAHAEHGAVLICFGDSPRLSRYEDRCAVIRVPEEVDFFQSFNAIQQVFDRFDAWETDLANIIDDDADISRMLNRSEDILGEPLYAIDSDFRILGASNMATNLISPASFQSSDGSNLQLAAFDQFLEVDELHLEEHEPIRIDLLDTSTLNCNLYEHDSYSGCVTMQYTNREYRPSDELILSHLATMLLRALRQLSRNASDGRGSLRRAVQDLVEGFPLDALGRAAFERAAQGRKLVCMRLKLSNRLANLPIGYVRNMVESTFPRSLTFEHHKNSVVAFIDLDELDKKLSYQEAIREGIKPFTNTMGMRAGLSDPVEDLMQARLYYLEANAALENGALFAPDEALCEFQDHILKDMIVSSLGELPLELLCPAGLRALITHDANSPTSYVETLRVYLENNTSVTATAKKLYVHRSTLLERLTRIKRELMLDLDDPDTQLRLRMLLKALEVRDQIQDQVDV